MFNTGLIDSLKIRVPLRDITVYDKRFVSDYIEYYPTLEHLDGDTQEKFGDGMKKATPYTKIIDGITYRFYVKAFINSKKVAVEYVVFQISAKMAKKEYFNGITATNIKQIIDDINSFKIIKVSYYHFLQGLISDIDICINQLIDIKSLQSAFSLIEQFPKPSCKPLLHRFNNMTDKSMNVGMDFNKRDKATNSKPYCKIYHKGFELQTKSNAFYMAYLHPLKSSLLNNLVRYEFTIKAHKHKEYLTKKGFNADFKTLQDLLDAKPKDLKEIAQSGLKHYLEESKQSKVSSDQNPTDVMLSYYIENLINLGFDKEKLLGFTYLIDCTVSRSRTKTKAKKLIQQLTNKNHLNEKIKINERANKFLSNFGFNF